MHWGNQEHAYGRVSRLLHLVMAAMVLAIIGLAWYAGNLPRGPEKGEVFFWHKSFGVLLLGLVIARLAWHRISPVPPARLSGMPGRLARVGHHLLYLLMFSMPMLGVLMSVAGGRDIQVFNWFTISGWDNQVEWLGSIAHTSHLVGANVLIVTIALHLIAALYHKLIARDGVWERMFGR